MNLEEAAVDLLSRTPEGSLRIVGTRVTLDCVIQAFREGATPEEMCQDEVDAYLKEQAQAAVALDQDLRPRYAPFLAELRQRLPVRRPSTPPPA